MAKILDPKSDPVYQTITGFNNMYEERNLLTPEEKIEAAQWFVENGFTYTLAVNPYMPDKCSIEDAKRLIDIIKPTGFVMHDYHKTSKSIHKHLYRDEYPKEIMSEARAAIRKHCIEKGVYYDIQDFEVNPTDDFNLKIFMNERFFGGNSIIYDAMLLDVIKRFDIYPDMEFVDVFFSGFLRFYEKQIRYFDGCIMKDTDYPLGSIRHPYKFEKKRFDMKYFLRCLWNQCKVDVFDYYSNAFDKDRNRVYVRNRAGFLKFQPKEAQKRKKPSKDDEIIIL